MGYKLVSNVPTVNSKDMTTSSHTSTFDARQLSFGLDDFLLKHSIQAIGSILGQGENCLDLVFTRTSEDITFFARGRPLYISYTNLIEQRKCSMWKGDFEGKKRHLHLQNWDIMLVGDIDTRWLTFKTVLLDLVEKFCPLARSKRPLAMSRLLNGSTETNEEEKVQAVFTRESSLPEAVLQSHFENAKIKKVRIACNNEKIKIP